jgi:primosomal protein N''
MKDYRTHLETLRQQAAEAALISALTTVQHKRELFAKHAQHLDALADEVERAMVAADGRSNLDIAHESLPEAPQPN